MNADENKLISVIIPVFNTKEYLAESVQSVLNQTFQNLEVILVDDGSTDGSGELCDDFAEKDSRIKVIHKANGGQSEARNRGLDIASGEYIGFVDSDDAVDPRMYEILISNMLREDAQISCCGTRLVMEDGKHSFYYENTAYFNLFTPKEALAVFPDNKLITGSLCDKLFKCNIFKDIRLKSGSIYEDFLVIPYCLLQAEKIVYTAEPLYVYRYTPQSTMRGHRSVRLYDVVPVCEELVELYKEACPEALPGMENQLYDQCLTLLFLSHGDREWDEKRKELLRILTSVESSTYHDLYWDNRLKVKLVNMSPELYVCLYRILQKLKRLVGKQNG